MNRMLNVPKWIFADMNLICDRCEVDFDSPNFKDDTISVHKIDDFPTGFYCNNCYEIRKNSKYEIATSEFKKWFNNIQTDSYSDFTINWIDNWVYRLEETKGVQYTLIGMKSDVDMILKIMSTIIPDYSLFEEISIKLEEVISKFEGCC